MAQRFIYLNDEYLCLDEALQVEVPRDFIKCDTIRKAMLRTIGKFNFDKRVTILAYHFLDLSIEEIHEATTLSKLVIIGYLLSFSNKLHYILLGLKKAVCHDADNYGTMGELLEYEMQKSMSENKAAHSFDREQTFKQIMQRLSRYAS